jgi:hypothetical protein
MTGVRYFSERTRPTDAASEIASRARWGGGGPWIVSIDPRSEEASVGSNGSH